MRFGRSNGKVRELEAKVDRLEQLVDLARSGITQRDALINELRPRACDELLLTANLATRFMRESFDWRQRAERAEAEIDFLAYSMVNDAFPEH